MTLALIVAEERISALIMGKGQLARELHNDVLQSLRAISLDIHLNRHGQASILEKPDRRYGFARAQLDRAILNLRRIILKLESGAVTKFSLASELRRLVDTYKSSSQTAVALDIRQRALDFLTQEEEHELLTLAREALSNCVRHADASQATISLRTRRTRVAFAICDNGKGFSPSDRSSASYGLANMAARMEKLGWRLHIQSQLGRGTLIRAEYVLGPSLLAV